MSKKYIGKMLGVPVYEDPDAPPGVIYFMREEYYKVDPAVRYDYKVKYSAWYRIKSWLTKRLS